MMRVTLRSLGVGFLALLGAVVVAISWTMTTAVQLQATTALIMGGTNNPDPDATYIADITQRYLDPFADLPYDPPPIGVHTPEQFFPVFGSQTFDDSVAEGVLDLQDAIDANTPNPGDRVIIVGYSQSARIVTIAKRNFIENYNPDDPDATPIAGFDLLSNPGKANGGILQRYKFFGTIPFFGITFDGDTPTNGPKNPDGSFVAPTKDITFLYDGISDHPVWALNLLALANALAGYIYLHGETPSADADLLYQGSAGDTDYYVIDSGIVPILRPLGSLGVPHFVLSALNEPVKVMIETAFRRDLGPGVPVQASLLPSVDPITFAINLISSIPVGIDNALDELGVGRRLGTTPSGPYGVGGPELPAPPDTTMVTTSRVSAPVAAEPDASQVDSLTRDAPSTEPAARVVATRNDNNAKSASSQPETTPTAVTEPKAKPTTVETKPEPPAKKPDKPKVRGPIEVDSKKKPTESPSSPSNERSEAGETTAAETNSTAASDPRSSSGTEKRSSGTEKKDAA
jgi:hypothetical protein